MKTLGTFKARRPLGDEESVQRGDRQGQRSLLSDSYEYLT